MKLINGLPARLTKNLTLFISDYANVQSLALWTAAVVTGLVAIAYAYIFRIIETWFVALLAQSPAVTFILTPACFLFAWWVVKKFAPEAGGSGIPQVMVAVELEYPGPSSAKVDKLLSLRTAAVKILSSLVCLAGGGAIGREGPTLQVSAAVFHFFGRFVRRFHPQSEERTWVIAGSAAGLASAFNTPLGGIVYAIEELAANHFHRIRTALFTAVIISGVVSQIVLGSYLYLGYPILQPMTAATWPWVIVTGLVTGLMGALFSRGLLSALAWKARFKVYWALPLLACVFGLGAAILNFSTPANSGPGSHLINDILFHGDLADMATIIGRILASAFAYLSGAAGGIFSPSLTIGACIGSKIAYLAGSPNSNLLAMLGMIGFLTGLTHTPFTSFILVLEMSDRHSAVFPMMIAAILAHGIAKLVDKKSFYENVRDQMLQAVKPADGRPIAT